MSDRDSWGDRRARPRAGRDLFAFDPLGPEKACRDARAAFESQELARAVALYLVALERLHDLYVLEGFATRRPSATDAVVVDGLIAAIDALRAWEPDTDVVAACEQAINVLEGMAAAASLADLDAGLFVRGTGRLRVLLVGD